MSEPFYEPTNEPNKHDPVLCYVSGWQAYFTTRELSEQWGDDWNDAPYEHNAGTPYGPSKSFSRLVDGVWSSGTQYDGDRPGWTITRVVFDGQGWQTPSEGHINSPYSVQDINASAVPWLWNPETRKAIPAGTKLSEFGKLVPCIGHPSKVEAAAELFRQACLPTPEMIAEGIISWSWSIKAESAATELFRVLEHKDAP